MTPEIDTQKINDYFGEKFDLYGLSPRGADWNSSQAQEIRFHQLLKIVKNPDNFFSLLDFGCGSGALFNYMQSMGFNDFYYYGYDILESAIAAAQKQKSSFKQCNFTTNLNEIPPVDYLVCSGVFNIKHNYSYQDWTDYVIENLARFFSLTRKGFACNFLTKYSDPDRMQDHLYYPDPLYLFDFCKTHFSRNVALLHDYEIYDFTLLVRKNAVDDEK